MMICGAEGIAVNLPRHKKRPSVPRQGVKLMGLLANRAKHNFLALCEKIQWGRMKIITPEGEQHVFGQSGIEAEIRIHDWAAIGIAATRGNVGIGEAYVAGLWDTPSIENWCTVALRNLAHFNNFSTPNFWTNLKFQAIDRILRVNSIRGAPRNIRAHYDVGNEFYQLWLDPTMTYSSALYADNCDDLEQAQLRKYDRILNTLAEGETILDIGCGWGGFAERAVDQGRDVTGITISSNQLEYATTRLKGKAKIILEDYRKVTGTFDNIVSIEMIEAVGERYWPAYFGTLKARLAKNGRALIQAITVPDDSFATYRNCSDFIRQYTFPGGMLLSDQVIQNQAHRAGLQVCSSFSFGEHYARTCRSWAERLEKVLPKVRSLHYGEAFIRSWRYYLEICAASFAIGRTNVVQVELGHE